MVRRSIRGRMGTGTDVRSRAVERVKRAVGWYGDRNGSTLAAAVTYFAFLSFFPLLALAFASIGLAARIVPEAESVLGPAVNSVLPGMVGDGRGQLSLDEMRELAGAVGGIGLVAVLYTGLGWISQMRVALTSMFDVPEREPDAFSGKVRLFLLGKGRDLLALAVLGTVLLFSVGVSTALVGGFDGWLAAFGSAVVGILANSLLFAALFRLLADPDLPRKALIRGALLGAAGFEALKQLSRFLLASTTNQPAFQAFGIALILLVWIYYFSRLVLLAAAWSATEENAARGCGETAPRNMADVQHP
jgi:membrane protein